MKHLTKIDLMLLINNREKLSKNTTESGSHIQICKICKTQLNEIRKNLRTFKIQNEEQCNHFRNLLLDQLINAQEPDVTHELQEHLTECEFCQQIYESTRISSPLDYAANLNFDIPQHFLKQLDMQIYAELEKLAFSGYLVQKADDFVSRIEKGLRILQISLFPVPAFNATRGDDTPEFFIFAHKGGKIQLQIGFPNQNVKLFGIFKDKIYQNKSDLQGNVFFENLPKDDYRVEVKGYNVGNIKIAM